MKKIFILLIGIACFTTTYSQKKDITLEEIWKENQFYPKNFSGLNSMNDGEHYVKMKKTEDGQEIIKYGFKNGKKIRTLFKSTDFEIPRVRRYTFSQDEKQLLLATETERIYRYSSKSIYYVYNVFTDKLKKLSEDKVMYATLSPNGKKVAYVFENNL